MRPQTNAEIAKALCEQSHYAQDSETKWLMETAAMRLLEIAVAPPVLPPISGEAIKAPGNDLAGQPAEAPQNGEEQNAPPRAAAPSNKPDRLPRKTKKAED